MKTIATVIEFYPQDMYNSKDIQITSDNGIIFLFYYIKIRHFSSIQFSSVTQSCPTLCGPMDCNMPGFPIHHQLLELAQTHVHQAGDAIQPSHPLLSPSLAFNLSQHLGLFK